MSTSTKNMTFDLEGQGQGQNPVQGLHGRRRLVCVFVVTLQPKRLDRFRWDFTCGMSLGLRRV